MQVKKSSSEPYDIQAHLIEAFVLFRAQFERKCWENLIYYKLIEIHNNHPECAVPNLTD